jgi:hypothetical protein
MSPLFYLPSLPPFSLSVFPASLTILCSICFQYPANASVLPLPPPPSTVPSLISSEICTGTRLHQVRRLAPEFYMPLPHYYSWSKVIWDFVTDPAVTPFK